MRQRQTLIPKEYRVSLADLNPGDRFGRLTALATRERRPVGYKGDTSVFVLFRCDCGTEKFIRYCEVQIGRTSSCGCHSSEVVSARNYKHGESDTNLHSVWQGIHRRCKNKNEPAYPNYGGRGITVAEEWSDYTSFAKWARENGYRKGLEIDRIDNDGGYGPHNCRFVTRLENSHNKRNNRLVTAFGETKLLIEWTRDSRCQVSRKSLANRLNSGKMTPEDAITMAVSHG